MATKKAANKKAETKPAAPKPVKATKPVKEKNTGEIVQAWETGKAIKCAKDESAN